MFHIAAAMEAAMPATGGRDMLFVFFFFSLSSGCLVFGALAAVGVGMGFTSRAGRACSAVTLSILFFPKTIVLIGVGLARGLLLSKS